MLLLAGALLVFFLLYQKKLVSQQLELHRLQSAYQKEMLGAAVEAEERERQRIGSDLHDGLGSSLSAAKVLLAQLPTPTAHDQEVVQLIRQTLGDSLQEIRQISHSLHPAVLARFGLSEAIQHLGFVHATALPDGFEVDADFSTSLSQPQELALYRIVQELVSNVLRHAGATHLAVRLYQHPTGLTLEVSDNGSGFDYTQAARNGGLGLRSVAARVSLLNATLHLEPAQPRGTRIRVEMPLLNL